MVKIKTLYIHSGKFHADDVMCAALCELAFNAETIRVTHVLPEYDREDAIIADIGFGKYDHHQPDCELRADGMPYAACGLVFRDIWQYIFPDEFFADRFTKQYIIPIELHDNGISKDPLSMAVNSFISPESSDPDDMEISFRKAVEFIKIIVSNEKERAYAQKPFFEQMMKEYESSDKTIVTLDKYIPGIERLISTPARYILFPSNRGGWNIQTVPLSVGAFGNKKDLPAEWLTSKPKGCIFVHKGLFLANFETKEDAINALISSGSL